ncbi:MAG: hypothetical protein AAF696_16515 [Bacteroidota bacterium]
MMDYFSFISKEYDGRRHSYDRKYVYILIGEYFYFRRLAKGSVQQNEIKRLPLSPELKKEVLKLLKSGQLFQKESVHLAKNDEGIIKRINIGLEAGGEAAHQLYTGDEFQLHEEKPALESLWRLLDAYSKEQKEKEVVPSSKGHIDLRFSLLREIKSRARAEFLKYELNAGRLSKQNLLSGVTQAVLLEPEDVGILAGFFEEAWEKLSVNDLKILKGQTALLDNKVKMALKLTFEGKSQEIEMSGWHVNLIDHLPFLLMEFLERMLNRHIQTPYPQSLDSPEQHK